MPGMIKMMNLRSKLLKSETCEEWVVVPMQFWSKYRKK